RHPAQLFAEQPRRRGGGEPPVAADPRRVGASLPAAARQLPGSPPHRVPGPLRVQLAAGRRGLPAAGAAARAADGRRRSALRGMVERRGAGLHRFAVLTAGATFVLLFVGGLVTSTGSGLAVPDWPLSFGMLLPPMRGGVLFEHGHRLAAALVGGLTVALALWTVVGEPR